MHKRNATIIRLRQYICVTFSRDIENVAANRENLTNFGQRFAEISPNEFHCAVF